MRRSLLICILVSQLLLLPAFPAKAVDADLPEWASCTAEALDEARDTNGWAPLRIGDAIAYDLDTIPYLPYGHRIYAINGNSDRTLLWGGPVIVAEMAYAKDADPSVDPLYVARLHLTCGRAFRRGGYFNPDQKLVALDIDAIESFECGIDPVLFAPAVFLIIVAAVIAARLTYKRRHPESKAPQSPYL